VRRALRARQITRGEEEEARLAALVAEYSAAPRRASWRGAGAGERAGVSLRLELDYEARVGPPDDRSAAQRFGLRLAQELADFLDVCPPPALPPHPPLAHPSLARPPPLSTAPPHTPRRGGAAARRRGGSG